MQVDIDEAKTRLSELVEAAHYGQTVVIAKAGTPLAKLGPPNDPQRPIRLGLMKDEIQIAEDFDAPLPEDVLTDFEGANRW